MPILDFRWLFLALAVCLFPFSALYIGVHVLKPYVLFGFIYVVMALWCLSGKVFFYLKTPFVTAVLFFLLYIFLSFFWSENQHATLMALIKITFVLVLCFVWAVDIKENNKQFVSSVILTLSALVVTVFSLWKCYLFGFDKISLMFLNGAVHSGEQEFTEFIKSIFVSNPIAQYHHGIAIYVIFCFGLVLTLLNKKATVAEKGLITLMSLASVVIIFMTLSKTAIIAYFILMMALLFNHRWIFGINILLCFVILISNPFYVRNAVFERFSIIFTVYDHMSHIQVPPKQEDVEVPPKQEVVEVPPKQEVVEVPPKQLNTSDAGVSERVKLWSAAINLFQERPWLGHGYRALGDRYNAVSEDDAKYPHNIVLQILSELGMVGFFISLVVFYYLMRSFWSFREKAFFGKLGFVLMSLSSIMISLQLEEFYIWFGFFMIAFHNFTANQIILKGGHRE